MNNLMSIAKGAAPLILLISFLIAMIVPLHSLIIDFCIVFSFAIAITIYLRAATIKEWDDFKTFPTLLLLTAVFRISLNIATTKKILSDGEPGDVIVQFGNFVVGSSIWLGFVVFLIIIVVQFIIANGSSRLSEVSARFTLDAMPGKQMSIDSDLNAGLISPEEAKERRKKLDLQVDFFGHMDGAGKFIKGDVWLGLILVFVNIIFGFVVGMTVHGMNIQEALNTYTLLTIGDGIVNQICSFLITVAAAVVMTRVYDGDGKDQNVTKNIWMELTSSPIVTNVVGGLFLFMGLFTPLPVIPFVLMSLVMFYIGYLKQKDVKEKMAKEEKEKILEMEDAQLQNREKVTRLTEVDPITLEVGFALIPVVNTETDGESIRDKITLMRKNIAKEVGMKVPKVRVVDNSALTPYTKYNIKIKDSIVASGELKLNSLLAFKTAYVMKEIEGIPTLDPIFKEEAVWIAQEKANEAKDIGYQVLDPLSILSTHLNEVIKTHLYELLQRQEVQELLDEVGEKHKVVIDEIAKKEIDLSTIQGVLQNLLREGISIRDLSSILEAVIDGSKIYDKVDDITMIVREKISKHLCEKNTSFDGKVHVLLLEDAIEKEAETYLRHDGYYLKMNILEEQAFVNGIKKQVQRAMMADMGLVLLTSRNDLRFALARLVHKHSIPISVMLTSELVQGSVIKRFGVVEPQEEAI